jgi:hypothetical protein
MERLETEIGTVYQDFGDKTIAFALTALNTTDNTFAILERSDGSIIQVANNGKKGFYVEMQDFKTKNTIRCDRNFSEIKDVIDLFIGFERKGIIAAPPKWIKTKSPTMHRVKVFDTLNYIGLALLIVSLYFVVTKNFSNNPLPKYIVLAGLWLMVPAAWLDAASLVNDLKRKVLDTQAWRSLIIIFIAVLWTAVVLFKD